MGVWHPPRVSPPQHLKAFNTQLPSKLRAALGHVAGISGTTEVWEIAPYKMTGTMQGTEKGCKRNYSRLQQDTTFWYMHCSAGSPTRTGDPHSQNTTHRAGCSLPLSFALLFISSFNPSISFPVCLNPHCPQGRSHTWMREKSPSEDGLSSSCQSLQD